MMDYEVMKQAVIRAAQEQGIAEYELYYQASESTSVSAYQQEVNEFTSSVDGGVCFRCIVGGRMGYASTEDLSPEQASDLVRRAAENAVTLETDDPVFLGEGGQSYEPLTIEHYELPSTEEIVETVLDSQKELFASDKAVTDGSTSECFAERSQMAIFNSRGLDLHYDNSAFGLVAAAVVSGGEEMANDYQIKLGDRKKINVQQTARKAVEGALSKLGGDVAPTGSYPVVFSPEAMSDILQTFCSVFSSEAAQKGLSRFADQEGKAVAAPIVTLVDDPFHKDNPMPINFDAEGSPTHRKNIIENGVLNTLLYNMKTAALAGKKTTGNASKAGYNSSVVVRPFTMYLAPGQVTEEELLQKAGNGVYINSLGGLHAGANPISGDFSLQSGGFLIENGKKTTPVKSFTVAGNFYDLLNQITLVADNTQLPSAFGMTAFGAPTVLAEGLSVAGK